MLPNQVLSKLRSFEIFKDVPNTQLEWLIREGEIIELETDASLWATNEIVDRTFIVLEGEIKIARRISNQYQELTSIEEGGVTGYLPYSRIKNAFAGGVIGKPSKILIFPKAKTRELIAGNFELTQALVSVMTGRVKEGMERQKQNEKMMALGKLSAGLAHELNNPISAIIRSSEALQKHLKLIPEAFKNVISIKMGPEEVDEVNNILFQKLLEKKDRILSPLERADHEDEIVEWLDQLNVQNSVEIAENLVEFGFTCDELELFSKMIPGNHFDPIINWINNNLITEKTVKEIQEGSNRISSLINSIKVYTHMDRDREKQEADIHEGIRNTLVILGHKIRKGNIKLIENYDPQISKVNIMAGEMNQVWTNLLDNAIDAMEDSEEKLLEIKSRKDGNFVRVDIIDSGKGIPQEIKDRIFEPFFTTKEVGRGTGLGLDLVSSIITQHKGKVKVTSIPGRTDFEVCIPIS